MMFYIIIIVIFSTELLIKLTLFFVFSFKLIEMDILPLWLGNILGLTTLTSTYKSFVISCLKKRKH